MRDEKGAPKGQSKRAEHGGGANFRPRAVASWVHEDVGVGTLGLKKKTQPLKKMWRWPASARRLAITRHRYDFIGCNAVRCWREVVTPWGALGVNVGGGWNTKWVVVVVDGWVRRGTVVFARRWEMSKQVTGQLNGASEPRHALQAASGGRRRGPPRAGALRRSRATSAVGRIGM